MGNALFRVWILAGLTLLAYAASLGVTNYRFKAGALTLPGEVIASSSPGQSSRTRTPIVRYVTPAGERREHTYDAPLAGEEFTIGDRVDVLFDARTGRAQLDNWSERYLWCSLLGFAAVIILLPPAVAGLIYLYVRR